ncbi:hypothetical protein DICPUDRAFT_158910, partial [Dictyostelium purpureum]
RNFETKETTFKIELYESSGEGTVIIQPKNTKPETIVFQDSVEFSRIYYGSLLFFTNSGKETLKLTTDCPYEPYV